MNIIPLFQSFVNHLSNILVNDKFLHEIEHDILHSTNDLNKDPTIFISGDGGPWIKGYDVAFPTAIYVLDLSIISIKSSLLYLKRILLLLL